MTTEFNNIEGIFTIQHTLYTKDNTPVDSNKTIGTGKTGLVFYGKDTYACVYDRTNKRNNPGTQVIAEHLSLDEYAVFVPKGFEGPATEVGLPKELGTIKVS